MKLMDTNRSIPYWFPYTSKILYFVYYNSSTSKFFPDQVSPTANMDWYTYPRNYFIWFKLIITYLAQLSVSIIRVFIIICCTIQTNLINIVLPVIPIHCLHITFHFHRKLLNSTNFVPFVESTNMGGFHCLLGIQVFLGLIILNLLY